MTNISRSMNQKLGTLSGVLLALLLCLTGCQKERFVTEEDLDYRHTADFDEGSTYMSLALRTNPPTTPTSDPAGQQEGGTKDGKESQTGNEEFTTWPGDDIIENFAVYIVSEGIDKVQCIAGSVTDNTLATWNPTKQELRLHPFRTPPVSKRIFAFFNIPKQYQNYLGETLNDREQFLKRIAEPIPYRGEPGVTYDQDAPVLDAFRPDSHIAKKVATKDKIDNLLSLTKEGREADLINPWQSVDYPNKFSDRYGELMKMGSITFYKRKDRIMASGERYNYLPEDYITKEEVEEEDRNLVQVYTRRVLAQAVVTAEASLVESPNFAGLEDMKGMKLVGLSFQVLNFEPTFYPIAKTTKEGAWPGNSNTMTPLYGKDDNSSRINLYTYTSTYDNDEKFEPETLTTDRFFRSAHFVYDLPSIKELKQDDPDYAQKLLREREITSDGKIDGSGPYTDFVAPKHTTTFWGSCYVTESTQKWGTDPHSGYTTANTPFFALVAAFDTESLPWGDNTKTTAEAKINNRQQDLEKALKAWKNEKAAKEARLKELEKKHSGSAGGDAWAPADATFKAWCDTVARAFKYPEDKRTIEYYPVEQKFTGWYVHFEEIKHMRKIYREGKDETLNNYTQFYDCIAGKESTKNNPKPTKWLSTFERTLYTRQLVIRNSDSPSDKQFKRKAKERLPQLWKQLQEQDKERESNPDSAEMDQLRKDIQALDDKIKAFEDEFKSSDKKYPKDENSGHNLEFYTQFIYEQGITRIFYSQVDKKFYLNYHEIPLTSRATHTHTLSVDDPWLQDLKNKLPNGKDFPTEANGVPASAAVLPPDTPGLMEKLSKLLNREIKETDLNPEERHSMDFYLYGRVTPGMKEYFFGKGADRTKMVDLQSGYVAWDTAKTPDRVVSYPCYIREKNVDEYGREKKASIQKGRLMMVYYAWVNPNTTDPSNWYASPVLRNNIYHMHITGFTQVGLSAIPFVPRITEGKGYKFLHTPFDPDEVVPKDAPLVNTGGAGQPTVNLARSSSYTITF